MGSTFFPTAGFGWAFIAALLGFLLVACVIDLRTWRLPKWLTLGLVPPGLIVNTARGGWLGADGQRVWQLAPGGAGTGAADGLLFALAGAAAGFALFNVLFATGTCGGGDVKLATGLGAWIGPRLTLGMLAGTVLVVAAFLFARVLVRVLMRKRAAGPDERYLNYSVPVTVVLLPLLPWAFRADLHLVAAKPAPTPTEVSSRAR